MTVIVQEVSSIEFHVFKIILQVITSLHLFCFQCDSVPTANWNQITKNQ